MEMVRKRQRDEWLIRTLDHMTTEAGRPQELQDASPRANSVVSRPVNLGQVKKGKNCALD